MVVPYVYIIPAKDFFPLLYYIQDPTLKDNKENRRANYLSV